MRELLESIKAVVDEIYQADPDTWQATSMVLFPPADKQRIKRFFSEPPVQGIPETYADFLMASDGMDEGWGRMDFFGTDRPRWKKLKDRIELLSRTVRGNVNYQIGEPNDSNIRKWETKRNSLYPGFHPVVGVTSQAGTIVYDSHARDKTGRMDVCDWALGDGIRGRYVSLQEYFEACLREAETYRSQKLRKKKHR